LFSPVQIRLIFRFPQTRQQIPVVPTALTRTRTTDM